MFGTLIIVNLKWARSLGAAILEKLERQFGKVLNRFKLHYRLTIVGTEVAVKILHHDSLGSHMDFKTFYKELEILRFAVQAFGIATYCF